MFYAVRVQQTSIFSAEVRSPAIFDLAGVLCGPGQLVSSGRTSARLSVVVTEPWRAQALAEECELRGLAAEVAIADRGQPLVRTDFCAELMGLAQVWQRGAVKAVPSDFSLDGPTLRMWAIAAGRRTDNGFLFGLDLRAPDTHLPLIKAIDALGLRGARLGVRGGGPGIRVSGRRRLAALGELIGEIPAGADEWAAFRE